MPTKLCFIAILLLLLSLNLFSQEIVTVPEFGKVSVADLEMKDCAFENAVPAMNLLKYEEVAFTSTESSYYKVVTQKRYRIKIFNANGFKYANVSLTYAGGNKDFKISDIDAVTFNLDEKGQIKISTLNVNDIFKQKGSKKKSSNTISFTLPDVKPGCIIEYRYTITEKESNYIAPWYFQNDIPNLLSACKISIPVESALDKRVIGIDSVEEGSEIDNSKGFASRRRVRSFSLRNVASFKSEPFMSSSNDYKQKVEFMLDPYETFYEAKTRESNSSWGQINTRLLGSPFFGWHFDRAILGTENFIDSTKKLEKISEKVSAVYNYVKKNIKWDDYYSIYAGNLQTVWNDKEGSSGEINLLILNLLKKSGVDCYPLIFSTRNHGRTDYKFVSLNQFNSVDVLVFDNVYYYVLDGTSKYLPYNVPPYNIISRDAFIIDPQYSKWVNIADSRPLLYDSISVNAKIDSDGILKGQTVQTFYDLSKAVKSQNDEGNDDDNKEHETFIASEIKTDTSYKTNNESDVLPLIETTQFHYELPSTNEFYFLSPFLFSGLSKNPFTDSLRRSDVDFGSGIKHKVYMEIVVPKSMKVEELVNNKSIRTADTSMVFNCITKYANDTVFVNSTFEINRPVFLQEEYEVVRAFFKNIYTLLSSQILFKKIE